MMTRPAPLRPAGSVRKINAAGSEVFGMGLQPGNQMLRSDLLDPVHVRKSSTDLARHTTVNMTLRVYARSRWERRGELAEAVGRMVNPGPEHIEKYATGVLRKRKGIGNYGQGQGKSWCERGDLNPHDLAAAGP